VTSGGTFLDVQGRHRRPWKEELSSEEIHLDLLPLASAVVRYPIGPEGYSVRGAKGVDLEGRRGLGSAAELDVTNLVRHKKRVDEILFAILMHDQQGVRIEMRAPSVEARVTPGDPRNLETSPIGLR
jgi:hypothetical protein